MEAEKRGLSEQLKASLDSQSTQAKSELKAEAVQSQFDKQTRHKRELQEQNKKLSNDASLLGKTVQGQAARIREQEGQISSLEQQLRQSQTAFEELQAQQHFARIESAKAADEATREKEEMKCAQCPEHLEQITTL